MPHPYLLAGAIAVDDIRHDLEQAVAASQR